MLKCRVHSTTKAKKQTNKQKYKTKQTKQKQTEHTEKKKKKPKEKNSSLIIFMCTNIKELILFLMILAVIMTHKFSWSETRLLM